MSKFYRFESTDKHDGSFLLNAEAITAIKFVSDSKTVIFTANKTFMVDKSIEAVCKYLGIKVVK